MALTAYDQILKEYDREWQENYVSYMQRAYRAGPGATLASMSLEPNSGDTLLDSPASTHEVIHAEIKTIKGQRVAIATGVLEATV